MPSDIEVVGQTVERKPIVFDPKLSRDNPSKRYRAYLKEYKAMHDAGYGILMAEVLSSTFTILKIFWKVMTVKPYLIMDVGRDIFICRNTMKV